MSKISKERKVTYYIGIIMIVLGFILFFFRIPFYCEHDE
jgi:uncharacterized membrane protein HdeD (DUF308 family)